MRRGIAMFALIGGIVGCVAQAEVRETAGRKEFVWTARHAEGRQGAQRRLVDMERQGHAWRPGQGEAAQSCEDDHGRWRREGGMAANFPPRADTPFTSTTKKSARTTTSGRWIGTTSSRSW